MVLKLHQIYKNQQTKLYSNEKMRFYFKTMDRRAKWKKCVNCANMTIIDNNLNLKLFRQILYGVSYIHSKEIIHRDLKVNKASSNFGQIFKICYLSLEIYFFISIKFIRNIYMVSYLNFTFFFVSILIW